MAALIVFTLFVVLFGQTFRRLIRTKSSKKYLVVLFGLNLTAIVGGYVWVLTGPGYDDPGFKATAAQILGFKMLVTFTLLSIIFELWVLLSRDFKLPQRKLK